jgi:virginiamycin B lyase
MKVFPPNSRCGAAALGWLVLVAAMSLYLGVSPAMAEEPPPIPLGLGTHAGALTTGPDGNLWFSGAVFPSPGGRGTVVGRITPSGEVATFPVADRYDRGIGGIATGPDGNLWFADTAGNQIGRVTTAGKITKFPAWLKEPNSIAAGPDAALWFTGAGDAVGRIDLSGNVDLVSLPGGARPTGIVAGPDGALWIAETGLGRIARMSPDGGVTEFPLADPASLPRGIAAGPDGALWFTEEAAPRIGRITTIGEISEFPIPGKSGAYEIVAGPRGNLWFSTEFEIGSISPSGETGEPACVTGGCQLPVNSLAVGPDGKLWFATGVERYEGGGGGTVARQFGSGTIGRFVPPELAVRVGRHAGRVSGRLTSVRVDCDGGVAGENCSGDLELTARVPRTHSARKGKANVVVARRSYELAPTTGHRFSVRLSPRASRALSRQGKLAVRATATLAGGEATTQRLRLEPPRRR